MIYSLGGKAGGLWSGSRELISKIRYGPGVSVLHRDETDPWLLNLVMQNSTFKAHKQVVSPVFPGRDLLLLSSGGVSEVGRRPSLL